MPESHKPKKIVILGSGIASLTTAFELTNQPGWNALYDITVYQMGWRLGGKCASGRNVDDQESEHEPTYRIEEHGLHIFFGFYENAFRLMKQCYDELGYDGPFMTVTDAFKPHSLMVFGEYVNNRWYQWPFDFPTNHLLPWEGSRISSLWEHIRTTLKFMHNVVVTSPLFNSQSLDSKFSESQGLANWWERIAKQIEIGLEALDLIGEVTLLNVPDKLVQLLLKDPSRWLEWWENTIKQIETSLSAVDLSSEGAFLYLAYKLAESLPDSPRTHLQEHHCAIVKLLDRFMHRLRTKIDNAIALDEATLEGLIILDFAYANIRGLLAQGAIFHGSLDFLDEYDYIDWLRKQGAREFTLNSALVRSVYDMVYAFVAGDVQKPRLAAGVALRIFVHVLFKYNGAVMWKMQAGMGDTAIAPLYKVLQRRGVKFKFFHRVKHLHLSEDHKSIDSISISRQVNLKDEYPEYDPLIQVKQLLCWPNQPRYEQIVEGEKLKQQNTDLESFWTDWQDVGEVTLKAKEDFDVVLLGISLAALPYLCDELIQAEQKWRDMIEHVLTVPTQGGQLWLKPDLRQLGWKLSSPVFSTYVEPLDTYADMTHLLNQENWPSENYPLNIAYFTGVMADPGIAPSSDRDFPQRQQRLVEDTAINFLQNYIQNLWPKATTPENPQGLDWNLLVDLKNRQGQKRFDSQYWRININPTERYVLSVPGSNKYRLKTDESGFDNLYLTGDWINNGFNAGCVEATVISGMQAARAILSQCFQTAYPKEIIGEWDSWI